MASTFGSRVIYNLTSINVSRSGILGGARWIVPFRVKTLLEIVIDPTKQIFEEPITCLGRVVRLAKEEIPEKNHYSLILGINLTDFPDNSYWEKYLESLRA